MIWMFLNQFLSMKSTFTVVESLVNPRSFIWWLNLDLRTLKIDFWKGKGYDSLLSRGGKRLTINPNPKEVYIGLPTSTTISIVFCHEFFYHKLNFIKKSLLATNFIFISKNMASIILVEYITFFHKITHGKILFITMN